MGYKVEHINPRHTAVIVVDMENDFVEASSPMSSAQARAVIPNMQRVLRIARNTGMKVIFTTHAHRKDGSDRGRFSDLYPPIGCGQSLVRKSRGAEIYPDLAPRENEPVIEKCRYSAFFGTDLDIILRGADIKTVVIIGTTTENCCHATARDAMFRDYFVVFLADATGTFDYPDVGWGAMSAEQVHAATLTILAFSTADVMTVDDFEQKVALAKAA